MMMNDIAIVGVVEWAWLEFLFLAIGGFLIELLIVFIINIIYRKKIINYLIIILLVMISYVIVYWLNCIPTNYMGYISLSNNHDLFIKNSILFLILCIFSYSTILYFYNKINTSKIFKFTFFLFILVIMNVIYGTMFYPDPLYHDITFLTSLYEFLFLVTFFIFRPLYAIYTYAKESKDICINKYGKRPLITKE